MGIDWFLKLIFVSLICILKVCDLNFDLLGHLVIVHLGMPKSILAHSQNLSSLFCWSWRNVTLLARVVRSFAHVAEFSFCSQEWFEKNNKEIWAHYIS